MSDPRSLYAVVDLGSNSFHMVIMRNEVTKRMQTLVCIKRKVRLAAGLNRQNTLSREAMQRGWQCLKLFSEYLEDIPRINIRVVATATLRLACNADIFLQAATRILGFPIQVISGEEEARLIYQGVAQTTHGPPKRLVIDIGGGSTEIIAGYGAQANIMVSLPMGCVTWMERYFTDRHLTAKNFNHAQRTARTMIRPIAEQFQQHGWQICVSASGTVQALQETMHAQGMDETITLAKLRQIKQRAIQCNTLEELEIVGLTPGRAPVFPSGLAILIAIFQEMGIENITLAGGALREGLIHDMLPMPVEHDIRSHTIGYLQQRYLLDTDLALQVSQLAENFYRQTAKEWPSDSRCQELLRCACLIHEIGLSINFKQAPQHAAWLIRHLDLPGFTPAQQMLLAALLQNQSGTIDIRSLHQQNALAPQTAQRLCRLLRLAIIFSRRQHKSMTSTARLRASGDRLSVILPSTWLKKNPFRAEILKQEILLQRYVRWPLILEKNPHSSESTD